MIEREQLYNDFEGRVRGDAIWTIHLLEVRDGKECHFGEGKPNNPMFRMDGSAIEKMYLFNAAFRYANLTLMGTEYEKIPWEYFRERPLALSDDAYIKRKDERNYVYLWFDYYYHT